MDDRRRPAGRQGGLEAAGYVAQLTDVLAVEVPDSAGGLVSVLATTDAAGLDIEYMYAFSTAPGEQAGSSSASATPTGGGGAAATRPQRGRAGDPAAG